VVVAFSSRSRAKRGRYTPFIGGNQMGKKGEVIRRALALYDYIQKEAISKTARLIISDEANNREKEIVFTDGPR